MSSTPSRASIVERRGARGRVGRLVLAGRAVGSRGPRPGVEARFPMFGCTLITAGTGRYRDARHDVALGPGSLVLVVPGHPHWYGADRDGWDERFLVFDGPLFHLAADRGLLDIGQPVRTLVDTDRCAARFDFFRLRREPVTAADRDAEAAMVLALLAEMVGEGAPADGRRLSTWLERSIDILGSRLGEPLSPARVAEAVGMPYETWRRAFKVAVGVSPARFRLDRRLTAAADMLLTTGSSVRVIASDLGFTDERHLTARFRESYACTPAVFRGHASDRHR